MIKADSRSHKLEIEETSTTSTKEELTAILSAVYEEEILSRDEILDIIKTVLYENKYKHVDFQKRNKKNIFTDFFKKTNPKKSKVEVQTIYLDNANKEIKQALKNLLEKIGDESEGEC